MHQSGAGIASTRDTVANQLGMPTLPSKRRVRRSREERGMLAAHRECGGGDDRVPSANFQRNRSIGCGENKRYAIVIFLERFALEKGRR
jgi:hypothetical protein